jgi:hypothetical protein
MVHNEQSNNTHGGAPERKVIIQSHGKCEATNPFDWPSGELLRDLCRTIDSGHMSRIGFQGENNGFLSTTIAKSDGKQSLSEYWKASARRAMLDKFGYFFSDTVQGNTGTGSSHNDKSKSTNLPLQLDEVCVVQRRWFEVVKEIHEKQNYPFSDGIVDDPKLISDVTNEISDCRADFIDFVKYECCRSNQRQLQWSTMSCPRGVQFPLHAHPNIELIYCIRGSLYEIRMSGAPISRNFDNDENVLVGPRLTDITRSWSFDTLKAGQWLVNEVGSIHKSFTSAKSDGGCDLLVLWGGSHANIRFPPISPNIQAVVDRMHSNIHPDESNASNNSNCCSSSDSVTELFLPDSER